MKTTERFDRAVMKLYNAFHENRLYGLDCKACAVGNLCNNDYEWDNENDNIGERNFTEKYQEMTGYSSVELQTIELLFLYGIKQKDESSVFFNIYRNKKEQHFKGLCAVIEYLCELDNIPNIMDYTKLFETENNAPKYQLS